MRGDRSRRLHKAFLRDYYPINWSLLRDFSLGLKPHAKEIAKCLFRM